VGRVDPVVAVGVVEREMRLASSSPRPSSLWRSRRQAEMLEDAAGDALVLDDREQPHPARAPRADEHVHRVRALHEDSPRQPSLAAGVIGTYDVITSRMNATL
jgi:hypothetical protein